MLQKLTLLTETIIIKKHISVNIDLCKNKFLTCGKLFNLVIAANRRL